MIWITLSLSVSSQFVALGLRARVINCDSYNQTNVYFVFIFDFRSKQFEFKPESLPAMNTILLFRRPCYHGRMAIFSRPFVWYSYHWKGSITSASTGQVTYCRELRYVNKFQYVYSVRYRRYFSKETFLGALLMVYSWYIYVSIYLRVYIHFFQSHGTKTRK